MTEHAVEVFPGDRVLIQAHGQFDLQVTPVEQAIPTTPVVPWEDLRAQMPRNLHPEQPSRGSWWQRTPEQIDGVTIHHTMTVNYEATAAYCTRPTAQGGKGYPTTQYHFWVMPDGRILYLLDVVEGCWHDHAGDRNTHISVGMAGRLDIAPPPAVQLTATARLVAVLMAMYEIELTNVLGHCDWARKVWVTTVCPGWERAGWKGDFYKALDAAVAIYG